MFKNISEWYMKQKTTILLCAIVFVLTFYYAPYFMNKAVNGDFEGSIQNKLVWSIKGECFFVRPLNQTNTLLVRVKDCDKTEVTIKATK